jgi:hypothetical protein
MLTHFYTFYLSQDSEHIYCKKKSVLLSCDVQQGMKFITFENCTVPGYCTVSSDSSLPFRNNLSFPSSRMNSPFGDAPFVKRTNKTRSLENYSRRADWVECSKVCVSVPFCHRSHGQTSLDLVFSPSNGSGSLVAGFSLYRPYFLIADQ